MDLSKRFNCRKDKHLAEEALTTSDKSIVGEISSIDTMIVMRDRTCSNILMKENKTFRKSKVYHYNLATEALLNPVAFPDDEVKAEIVLELMEKSFRNSFLRQ